MPVCTLRAHARSYLHTACLTPICTLHATYCMPLRGACARCRGARGAHDVHDRAGTRPIAPVRGIAKVLAHAYVWPGLCWWWGWCSSEISWRPTRDFRHETYPACLRVYDTLGPRTESTGQVDPLGGASGVPVKREHDRCFQYDMLRCRFCAQAEQVANPPSPSSAATSLPARPSLSMPGLLAWAQSAAAESSLPCP